MKTLLNVIKITGFASLLFVNPTWAALSIVGADGSDGVFSPTVNTVIDLSQAVNTTWNTPGSGVGVYDPDKWAVIYKYSSVNIPADVTVTFTNHPSGAPVVWLVNGNVTIDGTVSLNGESAKSDRHSEPGPGGFRGGIAFQNTAAVNSGGFGPGGGGTHLSLGSYSEIGGNGSSLSNVTFGDTYGNARILPLMGGSGGGGASCATCQSYAGGAGGGALLIAVNNTFILNGSIDANGGNGRHSSNNSTARGGSGSGGAIRVISDSINGSGFLEATGGWYRWNNGEGYKAWAGAGRIRVETNSATGNVITYPQTEIVAPDSPVVLWPPTAAPSVNVVSVSGLNAPTDPTASLALGGADLVFDNTASADIVLETANVDPAATVSVRIVPKHGAPFSANAVHTSGTLSLSTWTATITPPVGFFAVQARAVNP